MLNRFPMEEWIHAGMKSEEMKAKMDDERSNTPSTHSSTSLTFPHTLVIMGDGCVICLDGFSETERETQRPAAYPCGK